jgi:predicted GNAT superfamily acetyltransferase
MQDVDVEIRRARGLEDYNAVVELQKEVWGYTALEDIAAQPMLMIANRFGGCVLVAEDASGRIIGFSFAKPGWNRDRKLLWWSHMTAVVQDYRGRNIGFRLKERQRAEAIAEGIEEIQWTFDPLQAMNAQFNVHKLGVVIREYEENIYGASLSPLHQGLPTDRFVAEWHLNSLRVRERLATSEPPVIFRDCDRIQRINGPDRQPNLGLRESPLLLEIPGNVNELKKTDLEQAKDWQGKIRASCLNYFGAGYIVTDFILVDNPRPQALYVLENENLPVLSRAP